MNLTSNTLQNITIDRMLKMHWTFHNFFKQQDFDFNVSVNIYLEILRDRYFSTVFVSGIKNRPLKLTFPDI